MKIVVGGYIVGYPLGGMTWHHLNYLLGLKSLGHDVTFFEDGAFLPPINPIDNSKGDPSYGVEYLKKSFARIDLNIPWHYRYGTFSAGLSIDELKSKLAEADLFIAVSGITPIEWYDLPKRSLVIDTDPVYTQARLVSDVDFKTYYASFSHRATFARLINSADCRLPTADLTWIPTNQPIDLNHWPAYHLKRNAHLTTVGKWEHATDRMIELNGKKIASNKSAEYEKIITLPARSGAAIEMRMAGLPDDLATRFEQNGWIIADAFEASRDSSAYQSWIRDSLGEFTVIKSLYAAEPSGWFSDRSACFLATGRPVITQSSGFEKWIETGEGLFTFSNLDEAARAVQSVMRDAEKHARAARALAEKYFDAKVVLQELLEQID